MSTSEAMITNIIENPQDDGPRLVYADWLEEQGRCDRAEFVRVQCEIAEMRLAGMPAVPLADGDPDATLARWTKLNRRADALLAANESEWLWNEIGVLDRESVRPFLNADKFENKWICDTAKFHWHRGFVSQVECRIADFAGDPCPEQYGDGWHKSPDYVSQKWACETCHGTGRMPSLGAALLRRSPIELVVVTDKEPYYSHGAQRRDRFSWHDINRAFSSGNHPESDLPTDIFDALQPEEVEHGGKIYPSADAANAALSDALIKLARERMESAHV